MFHGILHVKVHVHTLRETWSTQTRDVNLEYLCRVSLRVHACKSEVINERYCSKLKVTMCLCNYIITYVIYNLYLRSHTSSLYTVTSIGYVDKT